MSECNLFSVLNIHQSGVLAAPFGCYVADAMWNHCCLSTHSVYTIQPRNTFTVSLYLKPHTCVHVCLAVTCHMHFGSMIMIFQVLLQWHMGETDTEIRVSTESWPWGRKLSCHFCWDWKPGTFRSWIRCSTTELSPNSQDHIKTKILLQILAFKLPGETESDPLQWVWKCSAWQIWLHHWRSAPSKRFGYWL